MRALIIFLSLLLGCGTGEDERVVTNNCTLTVTNDPGVALEVSESADEAYVEEGAIPADDVDVELGQGDIEIFLCSDVVSFKDNEISVEGTLDLARGGMITYAEIFSR